MGIKAFQEFLEAHCSSACVSVDLLKISRTFVPKRRGRYPGNGRFCLIVDAESCLDRLYGGFFSDWVCGGQWNRMVGFLTTLMQACQSANMDLVVFFNGSLESQKMEDWYADQVGQKKKVNMVLRHIYNKGTPPPKVWWIPPVFLRGALRMALHHLGIGVATSMDDHAQEVIGYCREHAMQGIIAQDSVFAIFDPPRYFSSQNLKLTYKGSLETKEYIIDEIAKCLDLNPNRFCVFAALLGNHILPDSDLYDFFKELIAKASTESGKTVKTTPEHVIRIVVDYVRSLPDVSNLDLLGETVFRNSKGNRQELTSKLKQSVQYYMNGTQDGFLKYRPRHMAGPPRQGGYPAQQTKPQDLSGYADVHVSQGLTANGGDSSRLSPEVNWSLKKKQSGGKGQDIEFPSVSPEVIRIASERHQKGLMSPWIYQVLSQGEVKMFVTLEDDSNRELPTSIDLYRPVRQMVYSVLLNLNKLKIISENQNKEKGDASSLVQKNFEVPIKEWVVRRTGNQKPSFDLVMARPVEWKTPSIERMWLGQQPEDKTRRLRAFLTCMHSDSQLMLNTNYVPEHLLILCCILRYMLQFGRVLQRQELDAFLAMSVSPLLLDVQTMQDLKLPSVLPRGVALASLFMEGVETALFANDVCGSPIPWTMCCPWHFFDGKLFHFKLLKANNNTPLIDMCDGQVDQVLRVERMRQAILDGLKVEFAKPMFTQAAMYAGYPLPPYAQGPFQYRPAGMRGMPPVGRGLQPQMGFMSSMSPEGPPKTAGRGRGILGSSPVDGRGGQLEIAGVVVGSWGPNLSGGGRGRQQQQQQQHHSHSVSPRVMSVGGARRGGGMTRGAFRGRGQPMPMYGFGQGLRMPAERGYYLRPTRGVVRGIRRPAVRARPRVGKKGKASRPAAKGRGTTVDDVQEASTPEAVSGNEDSAREDVQNDSTAIFEDAVDFGSSAIGKPLMQNGLQSPDSGIQGDKSATDLTLNA